MSERRGIPIDSTDNKSKIRLNDVLKSSCRPDHLGFPVGTGGKEPICQCRRLTDMDLIPGWGRFPGGGGHGNPLQDSGLENPMEIPWAEEPGGLQSMRSQRDGHN